MPWFTDLVKCPEYSANVRQVTSILEYTCNPCEPTVYAGRGKATHPQQLRTCQHTFLQARIQKVHVVPQELINSLDIFQLCLKVPPVGFEDLKCRKGEDLLDEREHPSAQDEHSCAPLFELRMRRCGRAPGRGRVVGPHSRELLFDMFKVEEEPEEELVSQNRLTRDNEREGKLDAVVQR
jgi:hypothetical protein